MTSAEVRRAIEASLGRVPFQAPISAPYCEAVRNDLRAALPANASIEVYFVPSRFIVDVRLAGADARFELALR